MHIYTIDNIEYISPIEIYKKSPKHFTGCSRSKRILVQKMKDKNVINDLDFIYVAKTKTGYNKYETKSDKLPVFVGTLIKLEWYKQYLLSNPDLLNNITVDEFINGEILIDEKQQIIEQQLDTNDVSSMKEIILAENEKFRDIDDNTFEIKIYGERHYDKCYFSYDDICKGLDIEVDSCNLLKNNTYMLNEDYIYLNIPDNNRNVKGTSKNIHFTNQGLWKFVFNNRTEKSKLLRDWANKILYTHSIGTDEQKQSLASNLCGMSINQFQKQMAILCDERPSGIYCINLGTVLDIKKGVDINKLKEFMPNIDKLQDTDLIMKYGKSNDLLRRVKEHLITYKQYGLTDISIICSTLIDDCYLNSAENELKHIIDLRWSRCNLMKDFTEVFTIDKKDINYIIDNFSRLNKLYCMKYAEIQRSLDEAKKSLQMMEQINYGKDLLIKEKDLRIQDINSRIQEKDYVVKLLQEKEELMKRIINKL